MTCQPANNAATAPSALGRAPFPFLSKLAALGADLAGGTLGGDLFRASAWFEIATRMGMITSESLASALPGEAGGTWQELANKLSAWHLFSYADRITGIDANCTLEGIVERVSQLDSFTAVWLTEGLGYSYARRALNENRRAHLFNAQEADRLPERFLLPLHTGGGIAFAEAVLRGANMPSLHNSLHDLWKLCLENAHDSYAEATFEALGLVTITLFPQWVDAIDRELAYTSPRLTAFFWHGVGRGLYFLPSTFIPDSFTRGRALEIAGTLASTAEGCSNAIAGFAWAMTLVNIRHPHLISPILSAHEQQVADPRAFANGMASAMTLWSMIAPDDSNLDCFQAFLSSNAQSPVLSDAFRIAPLLEKSPSALFRVVAETPCWTC